MADISVRKALPRRAGWTIYVKSCYLIWLASHYAYKSLWSKLATCFIFRIFQLLLPLCRVPHRNGWHGAVRLPHTGSAGTLSLHRWPCAMRWLHRLSGGRGWGQKILHVLQDGKHSNISYHMPIPIGVFPLSLLFMSFNRIFPILSFVSLQTKAHLDVLADALLRWARGR